MVRRGRRVVVCLLQRLLLHYYYYYYHYYYYYYYYYYYSAMGRRSARSCEAVNDLMAVCFHERKRTMESSGSP